MEWKIECIFMRELITQEAEKLWFLGGGGIGGYRQRLDSAFR